VSARHAAIERDRISLGPRHAIGLEDEQVGTGG